MRIVRKELKKFGGFQLGSFFYKILVLRALEIIWGISYFYGSNHNLLNSWGSDSKYRHIYTRRRMQMHEQSDVYYICR